jgi:hypothetical protein
MMLFLRVILPTLLNKMTIKNISNMFAIFKLYQNQKTGIRAIRALDLFHYFITLSE